MTPAGSPHPYSDSHSPGALSAGTIAGFERSSNLMQRLRRDCPYFSTSSDSLVLARVVGGNAGLGPLATLWRRSCWEQPLLWRPAKAVGSQAS